MHANWLVQTRTGCNHRFRRTFSASATPSRQNGPTSSWGRCRRLQLERPRQLRRPHHADAAVRFVAAYYVVTAVCGPSRVGLTSPRLTLAAVPGRPFPGGRQVADLRQQFVGPSRVSSPESRPSISRPWRARAGTSRSPSGMKADLPVAAPRSRRGGVAGTPHPSRCVRIKPG